MSASLSSQPTAMADGHSSSSPHPRCLRLFGRLPIDVFTLLAQCLPLPDKLLHLTHVYRMVPSLSPLSFACDTLAWTPTLLSQLNTSPSPVHLSLLSLVPSALLAECDDTPHSIFSALCRLLNPPGAPPPFLALRSVTISDTWKTDDTGMHPFPSPIPGLCWCPRLTAVHFRLIRFPRTTLSPLFSQL